MSLRKAWLSLGVLAWTLQLGGTAYAGPVEVLNDVSISGTTPKNMVVPYYYGGNGLFLSQDGGATLQWLCAAGVDVSANNRSAVTFMSGDDHIYLGLFDGLLKGTADGCGFARVPELEKKYIRAITGDPIDPKRTYVTTSNPMLDNYIYMSDGSSAFAPLGAATPLWIDSLNVVKNGDSRRYYETVVAADAMTNQVTYSVRVSDDDGKTWSEDKFDMIDPADKLNPEFQIVAIDPKNPDHVLGHVSRSMGMDELYLSTEKGKTGSWKMIAEPVELGGATFTPDGSLYFGESDSTMRGLFVIASDGAEPKRINSDLRVFCVHYDDANKRLLGCANNYYFGSFDMTSGALTTMLDLRCAQYAAKCADKPEIQDVCQPPGVEFCKLDHWVLAPLCTVYDRGDDFCQYANALDYACDGGKFVDKEEGAPIPGCESGAAPTGSPSATTGCAGAGATCGQLTSGASAAGTSAVAAAGSGAGPAAAGNKAAAGGGGSSGSVAAAPAKGGCSISSVGSSRDAASSALWLGLVGVGFWASKRRSRRSSAAR